MDRLEPPGVARRAALWAGTAAAAAGVAASITAVYLGMRDLMVESGGTCASGGPYVVANECSSGQVVLLFGGVIAMLAFTGLHAAVTDWADGPQIGWPAVVGLMFIALGWNFIDLGLDPPREDGTAAGWLVSGVVFWLMAIGFLAPAAMRAAEWVRRGGEPEEPVFRNVNVRAALHPSSPDHVTETEAAPVPTRLVIPPGDPGP